MNAQSRTIKFNNASFNAEAGANKTEEEFLARFAPMFFLNLKLADREAILREAYRLCCKEMGVEPRGFNYSVALVTPVKEEAKPPEGNEPEGRPDPSELDQE